MKKIYLVRHGETLGNAGQYFQDEYTMLTDKGHTQAESTAKRLSTLPLQALVASPYTRAQQTAERVASTTGLAVETFNGFHECQQPVHIRGLSKTEGEGLAYEQKYLEYYIEDEPYAEGFENFLMVMERASECADFLRNHASDTIVVVSHCAFIHVFASFLLLQEEVNKEVSVKIAGSFAKMTNAGITEFSYNKGKWELVTWNDEAHFAE